MAQSSESKTKGAAVLLGLCAVGLLAWLLSLVLVAALFFVGYTLFSDMSLSARLGGSMVSSFVTLKLLSFVCETLELIPESWFNAKEKTKPCPECGKNLRTALAQQCMHCGADWHQKNSFNITRVWDNADVIPLKPMAKQILAFIGLFLLTVPWLVSVAAMFGLNGIPQRGAAARSVLTMLLNSYVLAGLSAMIGIMFLGFAVDGFEYRPRWLFWVLLTLGIAWLPILGAGTMLGLALILYALTNYRKFHPIQNSAG